MIFEPREPRNVAEVLFQTSCLREHLRDVEHWRCNHGSVIMSYDEVDDHEEQECEKNGEDYWPDTETMQFYSHFVPIDENTYVEKYVANINKRLIVLEQMLEMKKQELVHIKNRKK